MPNQHLNLPSTPRDPGVNAALVTLDLDLAVDACLYVGTGGTVNVITSNGQTVSFKVPSGQYIQVRCRRVLSSGTSATDIVAIW